MPRPPLTRSRIITAGVAIAGEIGLSAISFGAVARRVNSTATGVQRMIGSTELLHGVVDEVVVSWPVVPAKGLWWRRLSAWGVQTRTWLVGYPGLARHLLGHQRMIPVGLERLQQLADVLQQAGLVPAQTIMASRVLYCFVLEAGDLDDPDRALGGETADEATEGSAADNDAQFRLGLDLLLHGIAYRLQDGERRPSERLPTALAPCT